MVQTDIIIKGRLGIIGYKIFSGFMCGTNVLDKDGVSAAVVAAEMASYLADQGISLKQQLGNIYDK